MILSVTTRSINLICVIPTNHQFIVNPTAENLNVTDEVSGECENAIRGLYIGDIIAVCECGL